MCTTKTTITTWAMMIECETNYSINNKWNNTRHKHFTKHDTNDDFDLDNCVVYTVRWACTQSALFHNWCRLTPPCHPLLSTMDWYLEVRIQAGNRKYSSCLLVQKKKIMKILNILTLLYTSCTMLAQCMEVTQRRGILDWYWSCDSRGIDTPSNSIACNCPSRNISSMLYFKSC